MYIINVSIILIVLQGLVLNDLLFYIQLYKKLVSRPWRSFVFMHIHIIYSDVFFIYKTAHSKKSIVKKIIIF